MLSHPKRSDLHSVESRLLRMRPSVFHKKTPPSGGVYIVESGGDLLSRTVTSQVPSALKGLTSVFGMGTGGTPSSLPPEMVSYSIQPPTGAPRARSSLFRLFRSLLSSLSERSAPSIVLFFLFRGPRIALRNPDNCTAIDSGIYRPKFVFVFPIGLKIISEIKPSTY